MTEVCNIIGLQENNMEHSFINLLIDCIKFIHILGNQSPEWQTPIMTKILAMTKSQYLSFESIYIIDISIYLDLPARETDRQIYRLSIERIISINISINIYSCQPIVPLPSPPPSSLFQLLNLTSSTIINIIIKFVQKIYMTDCLP